MHRKRNGGQGVNRPARFAYLIAAALVTTGCAGSDQGAENERGAVDAYISALNNRDAAALERIAQSPVQFDYATFVSNKGGRGISVDTVDITKDFGPVMANAHVVGVDTNKQPYDERLVLKKVDDKWFVTMGEATPNKPGSDPSTTR
ncbi:hypothetical protein FKR81_26020 [Lentzea tibetensis]|uniref:DUF4878 domain-containing protein n=1 Tax=Lentzea tibetensis TaxID=2591470 RepID=A0A563EPC0_9PSEU|nr:hypothetical protein [Lentzea tibetensis]TWP49126.1 hypothetical protein FKR81_26020 [Lentzea tibetensis]